MKRPLSSLSTLSLAGALWSAGPVMVLANGIPPSVFLSDAGRDVPEVIIDTEGGNNDGSAPSTTVETVSEGKRFTCEMINGRYTVTYHPASEPGANYPWAVPQSLGGGWSAEKRCIEISRRLESYRPDGLLELQTNVENNYDTVCVTTEEAPGCRIVFTVPPGQNAIATRDQVFENLVQANEGQSTTGVNTFQDGGIAELLGQVEGLFGSQGSFGTVTNPHRATGQGIYLKPFLDQADGGTGEYLGTSRYRPQNRPSPRLDPSIFR